MPCNTCKLQFNLFKRKKNCLSCHYFYCTNCLGKQRKNFCIRCEIIHCSTKNELMLLKTKDLVFFLQSRKINITGIVEKEELCNLIINHINSSSYYESASSTPSDFENLANLDQIRQTCQNFFSSITEKITTDIQRSTCFNQSSQQNKKGNSTAKQQTRPCSDSTNVDNPGTSGINADNSETISQINVSVSLESSNNQADCECCSDEELAEISEKREIILNGDVNELFINVKNTKIRSTSSDSSFEEVETAVLKKHTDDDWQMVENEKSACFIDNQCRSNDTLFQAPNLIINKHTRRKSDSSLLNLKKSEDTDTSIPSTCNTEITNIQISCKKCGKSRSKIKEELLKLNEQLKSSNRSENEIHAKINQFIDYLDTKVESTETNELPSATDGPSTSYNIVTKTTDKNDEPPSCSFDPSKRFITLHDIHSSADLELLSVKQLKELLALNRVNFKGCCEKKELKERVQRLWESYVNSPSSDKLPSMDLCKICMDAPIECVFLECGHTATCTACGKVLSECPICRSYIVRVVRIFKS